MSNPMSDDMRRQYLHVFPDYFPPSRGEIKAAKTHIEKLAASDGYKIEWFEKVTQFVCNNVKQYGIKGVCKGATQ